MVDPGKVLAAATNILLVDWPNTDVPRSLLQAGFTVFGYSPDRYSTAELVDDRPTDIAEEHVFAPETDDVSGFLVFRTFEGKPESIDIVCVFRPPDEIPGIIENHALPLTASVLWLEPPLRSAEARELASEHGLEFVEGTEIARVARSLGQG